jgi:hypothetical protein
MNRQFVFETPAARLQPSGEITWLIWLAITWRGHSVNVGYLTIAIYMLAHAEKRGRSCSAHVSDMVRVLCIF